MQSGIVCAGSQRGCLLYTRRHIKEGFDFCTSIGEGNIRSSMQRHEGRKRKRSGDAAPDFDLLSSVRSRVKALRLNAAQQVPQPPHKPRPGPVASHRDQPPQGTGSDLPSGSPPGHRTPESQPSSPSHPPDLPILQQHQESSFPAQNSDVLLHLPDPAEPQQEPKDRARSRPADPEPPEVAISSQPRAEDPYLPGSRRNPSPEDASPRTSPHVAWGNKRPRRASGIVATSQGAGVSPGMGGGGGVKVVGRIGGGERGAAGVAGAVGGGEDPGVDSDASTESEGPEQHATRRAAPVVREEAFVERGRAPSPSR